MPLRFVARVAALSIWQRCLAVFALALAVYWPSVPGGVLWDDPAHLTRGDLQSWAGLGRILTQRGATQEYYPVLHGAFWVEHRLWGEWLPGYHLLNIGLHAASACLLAGALGRLWTRQAAGGSAIRRVPAGAEWVAAVLFVVHPVAVESVAWMTEQKNTLSVFFYLLAAVLYLRFEDHRRGRDYGLALVAFLFALGAKTATITLPAAILVLAWWKHGRISWRRDVLPLLPWFAAAVVAGLVTVDVETNFVGAHGADYVLTPAQRGVLATRIVWFYFAKLLWPHPVMFFYPRWNVATAAGGWWPYVVGTATVTAVLVIVARRMRGPLAAWLLFVGTLFPVLGFFNVFAFVFSYVADHFQYMGCLVFVAAMTGGVATVCAAAGRGARWAVMIGTAVLVCALGMQANRQSALYRDDRTLFGAVVALNPSAWMGHEILAVAYGKAGETEVAIAEYRRVLQLKPDHANAYHGLGVELMKQPGRAAEAIYNFERAIALLPQFAEAHHNLGLALATVPGRRPDAVAHLKVAVGLRPYLAESHVALADVLAADAATVAEALPEYGAALRIEPRSAPVHRAYGDALAKAGRPAEALMEYTAALGLDPTDATAHFHLADVLVGTSGRVAEAIPHYESAVRLNPALAAAHMHLATVLARSPDRRADALTHAQAAVQLAPQDVDAHNTLAILYAEEGDLPAARTEWQTALRINPQFSDARRNLQLLERMAAGGQ